MSTGEEMNATAIEAAPLLRRVEVTATGESEQTAELTEAKISTEHVSIDYGGRVAVRPLRRSVSTVLSRSGVSVGRSSSKRR